MYTTEAAAMESIAATLVPVGILVIALLLVTPILMGMLCKRLAHHKGYKGYFWMGFFLGILGFAYVFALPDRRVQKYLRAIASGKPLSGNASEQEE